MPRYKGLTLEQHQQIAADLLALQDKIHQMRMQISKAYGVSRKTTKSVVKLENKVKDLKSDMDTAYFNDLGREAPHTPYYPRKE